MTRTIVPSNAKLIPKEAKLVFKGVIFEVYQWQQQLFDGSFATFEMLRRPDTVKVVAVKNGKVVLLNEKQAGDAQRAYELPGGRHDVESETELDCAKRELHEETGMVFQDWKLLDVAQMVFKTEAFVYTFLATNFVRQDEPHIDPGEKIDVQLVDFEDCLAFSKTGDGQYLPTLIFEKAGSIEGLERLPEFKG